MDDGGSNLPYRTMADIKMFFQAIDIELQDAGSRTKTTDATLIKINGTPKLVQCVESALLPAHFIGKPDPGAALDLMLPHLEAVGSTLEVTKTRVRVTTDGANSSSERDDGVPELLGRKVYPTSIEDLLEQVFKGLRRSMFPLSHRRKGKTSLYFDDEYDLQDLLHSHLRIWIRNIEPEDPSPRFAGKSSKIDLVLPDYETVIETKYIRDRSHAKSVSKELIEDISRYRSHPKCKTLWCVIYDPNGLIQNPAAIIDDLSGPHSDKHNMVNVLVRIF